MLPLEDARVLLDDERPLVDVDPRLRPLDADWLRERDEELFLALGDELFRAPRFDDPLRVPDEERFLALGEELFRAPPEDWLLAPDELFRALDEERLLAVAADRLRAPDEDRLRPFERDDEDDDRPPPDDELPRLDEELLLLRCAWAAPPSGFASPCSMRT